MWNDIEATQDLLNFKVIADTAAQTIKMLNGQPISIGVSGSWGVGKSSLVKMIGESLKSIDDGKNYIFIDFNAWLYQGYDDARMALLQKVADKILEESQSREKCVDKAKEFIKRINWLRVIKFSTSIAAGMIAGGTIGGPVGSFIGGLSGLFSKNGPPTPEEFSDLRESYSKIAPDLHKLLNDKEEKSIPKEIAALRELFQQLLEKLDLTLVVLVDDLDRCLPDTAISTLEAMRLLLFIPRTAFIIAADEQMIRQAVRSHFGNSDLSEELVTSYFDKLIQIPFRVPRLGSNEVKGYVLLLLADLAQRRGEITEVEMKTGQDSILKSIKKGWSGGLTKKVIEDAYGGAATKLSVQIDLADQLANIMATSEQIAGNPRLIKRFLNNLIIRESIAKALGMSVAFGELVKLQIFERCASSKAFAYLAKEVGESEDGKPKFIKDLEEKISKGEDIKDDLKKSLNDSGTETFIIEWLKLAPPLAGIDLRPLLYLSRDKAVSLASFDELSPDGRALLNALCESDRILLPLVNQLKSVGEIEAEKIMTWMKRRARNHQWELSVLIQALHLPKAFPSLAQAYIQLLDNIPEKKRPVPIIPLIRNEAWSKDLLERWVKDSNSPIQVIKAITSTLTGRKK